MVIGMQNRKKDIIQFWVWLRNGTAFCTTWFLMIVLAYHHFLGIEVISTDSLIKLVFWIIGGVFIFNVCFTRLFINKWGFTKRLTCFMGAVSLYECLGFYSLGCFIGKGTIFQWVLFIFIVFLLYMVSIAIYQWYSKRQGEIYTQALRQYQQKRGMEDGK